MFLPTAMAPLLLVLAGLARIVGARGMSRSLMVAVGAMVLAPVLLGPLLTAVPNWVLILALPVMAVMVVGALVTALLGHRVWEEALGHVVARLLLPLSLISMVVLVLFVFL
jgi:hypothetical protein